MTELNNKKYFHQLSDDEIKKLLYKKVSIGYIKENYKQPDWCSMNSPMDGSFGCWTLMDLYNGRHDISVETCQDCDCFKL